MLVQKQWKKRLGWFSLREAPGAAWPRPPASARCGLGMELDVCVGDPVLLPTDWVWGTGQTASIVSFCLCKIGKFTLLGRAVMEIKYSHTYKKYFFQFEGGSRSIPTDAESGPCFRIGRYSYGWEKEGVCYGLTESFINIHMPMLFDGESLGR